MVWSSLPAPTCGLGPYNFEFMTEVTKEIVARYRVDGIFINRWSGSGMCYCEHCRRNFKAATGLELPRTNNPQDPARGGYMLWRQQRLFDLWQLWDAEVRRINPQACVIPNTGGGALSSLDMKRIGENAEMLAADRQARRGLTAPWARERWKARSQFVSPARTHPCPGHPLLKGLEDAPRIINGVWRVNVEPRAAFPAAPVTLIPSYPDLPMEKVYPRQPRTDIAQVYLRELPAAGNAPNASDENRKSQIEHRKSSRVVCFPWDLDRVFWGVMCVDHGQLLRNAITWATNEEPPVTVTGPGVLDVTIWKQRRSITVHLVNLTNPMVMKGHFAS